MADFDLPTGGAPILDGNKIPSIFEQAKSDIVTTLRKCFASSLADVNLRFNDDQTNTKIVVYKGAPNVIEFYPSIFVSVDTGSLEFKFLPDDFIGSNEQIDRFTNPVSFTFNISVFSRSQYERERLIDHLIFFLRFLFLGEFRRKYFLYTRQITMTGEEFSDLNGDKVYTTRIALPCYTEYSCDVSYEDLNTLIGVNVKMNL